MRVLVGLAIDLPPNVGVFAGVCVNACGPDQARHVTEASLFFSCRPQLGVTQTLPLLSLVSHMPKLTTFT